MGNELRFVFRAMPGPADECVFVECEDSSGRSVNAGEWRSRPDGFVELVVIQKGEQHQGEPVAYLCKSEGAKWLQYGSKVGAPWKPGEVQLIPLYTHPDSGEVERMRAENSLLRHDIASYLETMAKTCDLLGVDTQAAKNAEGKPSDVLFKHAQGLRAQLAERDALLSTAAAMLKECIDTGELDTDEQWRAEQIVAKIGGTEPIAPVERDELPRFAQTVIKKLKRFRDCAEDSQGADIGKTWFDVLVQLGLLNRVQRSPAYWEITDEGDALLEARAALERKS